MTEEGGVAPPGNIWQCLDFCLSVTAEGGSGWWEEGLLHRLGRGKDAGEHYIGLPPQQRSALPSC